MRKNISITPKTNKMFLKLWKIKPNFISQSTILAMAAEYYAENHAENQGKLTHIDIPSVYDDIDFWKDHIQGLSIGKTVEMAKKLQQIQDLLTDVVDKR